MYGWWGGRLTTDSFATKCQQVKHSQSSDIHVRKYSIEWWIIIATYKVHPDKTYWNEGIDIPRALRFNLEISVFQKKFYIHSKCSTNCHNIFDFPLFWRTFCFVLFTLEQILSDGVKLQISKRVQNLKSVQNFSRL